MKLALEVHMRFEAVDEAIDGVVMRTANISRDGMFIRMGLPKPVGTHVRVRVVMGAREILVEGVVVRASEVDDAELGVGVHLTSASEGWERLCDLVEARRRGEPIDPADLDLPPEVNDVIEMEADLPDEPVSRPPVSTDGDDHSPPPGEDEGAGGDGAR